MMKGCGIDWSRFCVYFANRVSFRFVVPPPPPQVSDAFGESTKTAALINVYNPSPNATITKVSSYLLGLSVVMVHVRVSKT